MKPKRKNILIHKLFCLSNLLIEDLDELKPTNQKVLKFKEDLIGFCEELTKAVEHTDPIQKSTYFTEISNKIDTILRKEFNPEM